MKEYHYLLNAILNRGIERPDRTGVGTKSIFGYQFRFDLGNGFPLVTTKKIHFKSVLTELLWMLRGDTNTAYLKRHGVSIWDEWADENGDLGPVYGKQWRSWDGLAIKTTTGAGEISGQHYVIDQMAQVQHSIRTNPYSRRHVVSAWNPAEVDDCKLPPCHCLFQFYVADGKLSCHLYQRSADAFLGVPFNIASYALLTMMLAHTCNLRPGHFIHSFGDVHLYLNHLDEARLQVGRAPMKLPTVFLNPTVKDIFKFTHDDVQLVGYESHPAIKAKVAV